MEYIVVERFAPGAAGAIYRRLEERGRVLPTGLEFIDSWVAEDLSCCFQLMRTHDPRLIEQWTEVWKDLCDFEIVPVISSGEARKRVLDNPELPSP